MTPPTVSLRRRKKQRFMAYWSQFAIDVPVCGGRSLDAPFSTSPNIKTTCSKILPSIDINPNDRIGCKEKSHPPLQILIKGRRTMWSSEGGISTVDSRTYVGIGVLSDAPGLLRQGI
ncbi:hypothetical protein RvY_00819 [Ramazzottius varieornatus]|uniref:Uncharacterized protein n=1 Tax=Ramazzottius varieornatus TaxID=947166 RepID=A0A1D1UF03_RAMVA|nr:hypothetical protein RvY_00819 [Ramazzottius varieornatus]